MPFRIFTISPWLSGMLSILVNLSICVGVLVVSPLSLIIEKVVSRPLSYRIFVWNLAIPPVTGLPLDSLGDAGPDGVDIVLVVDYYSPPNNACFALETSAEIFCPKFVKFVPHRRSSESVWLKNPFFVPCACGKYLFPLYFPNYVLRSPSSLKRFSRITPCQVKICHVISTGIK